MTTLDLASAERGAGLLGGAAPPARSRADLDVRYRRARRHSAHVRVLRVSVLATIALVLLAVVGANYLPVGGFRLPGEVGKLVIRGTKITMQQPRLTGFTNDARAYEFTANSADQDITNPNFVELQVIRAKMAMADKSKVNMTADTGVYDMKADKLTLNTNIHLVSSTGYEARLSQAVVEMRSGNVVSEKPVWVKLLDGFLDAKRLEIVENGDVIRFGGGVRMILQPRTETAKAGEP